MILIAANLLEMREFWIGTGLLVGVLLIGAAVLYSLDRWRRQPDQHSLPATTLMSQYREMYEDGEITRSEYERLRAKLALEIRGERNDTREIAIDLAQTGQIETMPKQTDDSTKPED